MRSLLRGFIAAAALSLAPVAVVTTVAAPSHAAATVATTSTFSGDIPKKGVYGGFLSLTGNTSNSDGSGSPFAGTVYLQRQTLGAKSWKNIYAGSASGAYYSGTFKAGSKYRVYYAGGTSGDTTWSPSVSPTITIKAFRKVDFSNVTGKRQPTADVKVSPKFGKKKLIVEKKQGKGYQTYRKFTTNTKGKVRISVPGSLKGTKYRLVAPKGNHFLTTKLKFTATRY